MFRVETTEVFDAWLDALRDRRAQQKIAQRLVRIEAGLLGDWKSVGDGVSEVRIDYGPGYRLYYTIREQVIVFLLCGSDKRDQRTAIAPGKGAGEASLGCWPGLVPRRGWNEGNEAMTKLKTKPFDAAQYIDTPEAVLELLNDAVESGHAGYLAKALGVAARSKGMTELAGQTGVNRQALYASLSENGNPTLDILLKVVSALGIRLHFEAEQLRAA